MKIYTALTREVVSKFGGRKGAPDVGVFVDTDTGYIYTIPQNIEHVEFICKMFNVTPKYIAQNSDNFSRFVPSVISFNYDDEITYVGTGVCGLETRYNVRHTEEQLARAHKLVMEFIDRGDFNKSHDFREELVTRYIRR